MEHTGSVTGDGAHITHVRAQDSRSVNHPPPPKCAHLGPTVRKQLNEGGRAGEKFTHPGTASVNVCMCMFVHMSHENAQTQLSHKTIHANIIIRTLHDNSFGNNRNHSKKNLAHCKITSKKGAWLPNADKGNRAMTFNPPKPPADTAHLPTPAPQEKAITYGEILRRGARCTHTHTHTHSTSKPRERSWVSKTQVFRVLTFSNHEYIYSRVKYIGSSNTFYIK